MRVVSYGSSAQARGMCLELAPIVSREYPVDPNRVFSSKFAGSVACSPGSQDALRPRNEESSPLKVKIGQDKRGVDAGGALGQAAVADSAEVPEPLHYMESMFSTRTYTRATSAEISPVIRDRRGGMTQSVDAVSDHLWWWSLTHAGPGRVLTVAARGN